jgi:ABC-type multidrug transport system ATPase subunit
VEEAYEFCDQVFFMKSGEIIERGHPQQICAKYLKGYQIQLNVNEIPNEQNNLEDCESNDNS